MVQALDFAPRHRDLAVQLARRFASSHKALANSLSPELREDYRERFFVWLAERVTPEGMRAQARQRLRSPSESDMRLIGLIDQYRAGGSRMDSSGCPLVHAANSPEA